MILLRSFLSGHIRIKRTREYYDAGIGPNVPFGAIGVSPVVSQNFLTNTTVPSWMDVSATTGNRMLYDSTGKLTWAPNNLVLNSATLSTQTVTVAVGVSYILSFYGTGSVALSGAATATVNGTGAGNRVYQKVTATTASLVLTVTGSVTSAQLEAVTYQTLPSTYIPTTAAAYYGPRFDYDPSTLAAKGLLIEESRANVFLNSDSLGAASWAAGLATKTANAFTAITGLTTGTIFTCSGNATVSSVTAGPYTVASGATVTQTFILKNTGTNTSPYLSIYDTAHRQAQFILSGAGSTANLDAGVTASITSLGNGFYSCVMTYTITGTTVYGNAFVSGTKTNGSATVGQTLYIDRAQLEVGSFATSYIPTTTASVTRAADIIKLSGAALTTLQGAAGTFLEEMTLEGNKAAAQYGAYGNAVSPLYWDSLVVKATNGTNVLSSAQTAVVGTAGRGGLAWNASGRAISFSGSAAVTDANSYGTIGATVYLGSNNGANSLNGWVRALSFYNQRLSNATLATKTTVGGPL